MKKVIKIDPASSKPKYRQIIDSVFCSIETNGLKKGDKMPSINQVCAEFDLSRDTVMVAFNELKEKGVLLSQPGKGYYIASTEIRREEKVFVLFDEFNAFKEDLYNSLIESLKEKASVEVFFHHFNYKVFKHLILESIGHFTSYIIMPGTFDNISHLISKLPKEKVYILDRLKPEFKNYPVIYQDFEQDFYDALNEGDKLLEKYRKLIFVNPGGKEPDERVKGFERFCREKNFKFQVLKSLKGTRPGLYEAYFLISDRDLVDLVKVAKNYQYNLGEKFGIVSFNDTVLKEVVSGGITTISTDFKAMGKNLGNMLLNHQLDRVRNPSKLIVRNSL
ncbi:transcriptional regulator, GntR family [Tangfeifania diversioriginum]|uniref:Transcriptional regulator, GntR family n=1 Tax=Tangfeifania diversioriginum TaxID=1168035 RepID=A0A1M6E7Y9_9BACT|nr:GntR family transcriptional regulator [Tangfeifania diversioriginum]SHI81499.1 transcriptional regulator, GntR family [Tangfeifania diversioriginum]